MESDLHRLAYNFEKAVDTINGKIVMLSIGMSNATQEFSVFKSLADADAAKNPRLAIVDGAQGRQTAVIISDSTANFWRVIDQRLRSANVTRAQVQVAWVKEADARPVRSRERRGWLGDHICGRMERCRVKMASFGNAAIFRTTARIPRRPGARKSRISC